MNELTAGRSRTGNDSIAVTASLTNGTNAGGAAEANLARRTPLEAVMANSRFPVSRFSNDRSQSNVDLSGCAIANGIGALLDHFAKIGPDAFGAVISIFATGALLKAKVASTALIDPSVIASAARV